MKNSNYLPAILGLLKALFLLLGTPKLGFHRDEMLYLALGRHLDWGYWSNPPFIGFISWLGQALLGDSLWAARFFTALYAGLFTWLVLRMVQEMGGGKWAVIICAGGLFGSIAWMRGFSMLQPVPFDFFFWTLSVYFLLRWVNTRNDHWWWAIGISIGVGMLNKYMLVFLGVGFALALLVPPYSKTLFTAGPWKALFAVVVICLPNILWQWHHDFPVIAHMRELREKQLSHVEPLHFLVDQLLFHAQGVLIWGAGLVVLLSAKAGKKYQFFGIYFISILVILLLLKGKSYYTIGAYPILFAAGAVYWEKVLRTTWARGVFAVLMAGLTLPLLPYALPIMSPSDLASYYEKIKIDGALRWENGKIHALPQDFADMLGWDEIGALTEKAILAAGGTDSLIVFGDNYGEAAAAELFALKKRGIAAISFSDSYRLWVPRTLPDNKQILIYINDELGSDVAALFRDIQLIGKVENQYAREKGTGVWLCRNPQKPLPEFWAARVQEVFAPNDRY